MKTPILSVVMLCGLIIALIQPLTALDAPMQWTANPLPFSLKQKLAEFNVKVWRGPGGTADISSGNDVIYVTSNNIMMTCRPLADAFKDYGNKDNGTLAGELAKAREKKEADDAISYGLTVAQMGAKAKEVGYFGSE